MINTVKLNREQKNITQEELASLLGVSRRTVSAIENGKSHPTIDMALQLSKILDVPVNNLFFSNATNEKLVDKVRFIDLFCGIGGFRFASERSFEKLKIESKCVFSSEIDEYAQKSYFANFGEMPSGDIIKIKSEDVPEHDLLFAGFPCQPFSIIGLGKGFDDTRGTLFFEIARIIDAKRPRAFVLENVKRLVSHDGGKTLKTIIQSLKSMGYCVDYKVLNALDFGLPQKRERVVIVGSLIPFNMEWPEKSIHKKTLNDILEEDVLPKHFASQEIVEKRKAKHTSKHYPAIWHENKGGNISSYPYSCALRAGASYNYLLVNGERRLTPREMLRLQGFPDKFKIDVNDSQIRKQAGNAVPVDMIAAVLDSFIPLVFRSDK